MSLDPIWLRPPEDWSLAADLMPPPREAPVLVLTKAERAAAEKAALLARQSEWIPDYLKGTKPPQKVLNAIRLGNHVEVDGEGNPRAAGVVHVPRVFGQPIPPNTERTTQPPFLFFNSTVLREDTFYMGGHKPELLSSRPGRLLVKALKKANFDDDDWAYTTYHKHLPPKGLTPPSKKSLDAWSRPAAEHDLLEIKPRFVVAMGVQVFHWLMGNKLPPTEMRGAFFKAHRKDEKGEDYEFLVYYLDEIEHYWRKPEYYDQLLQDLRRLRQELPSAVTEVAKPKVVQNYQTIETLEQLKVWLDYLRQNTRGFVWAVDCEWGGRALQVAQGENLPGKNNYLDGQLRSMQICWDPGQAVYLKFAFDNFDLNPELPCREAGLLLRAFIVERQIKYVGHNLVADLLWMEHHLDLPIEDRVLFDTMFAQHTLNEYADLKLERLACRYTDLGRYDLELWLWKRERNMPEWEGYARVPDHILIPYAIRDVDATMRVYPDLLKQIVAQNPAFERYHRNLLLPFVTYGFVELMKSGLQVDVAYLQSMRGNYLSLRNLLEKEFLEKMLEESVRLLREQVHQLSDDPMQILRINFEQWEDRLLQAEHNVNFEAWGNGDRDILRLEGELKHLTGAHWGTIYPFWLHRRDIRTFNLDSTPSVRRWLFQVKKLMPFKTTKKDGVQLNWSRVLELPPERRVQYEPSTDKQTMKTLSLNDGLITHAMQFKQVTTMLKSFLGGVDEETQTEQGLAKWVASDGAVHANYSLTETARPRTWNPNVLNWPKYLHKGLDKAFERLMPGKQYGLRSIVVAPPGYVILDMDLKTAEVVALARYANDPAFLSELNDPDTQFVRIDANDPSKRLRICYNHIEGIPEANWDPQYLVPETDPRLLRKPDGSFWHPKRDLHWEMATAVFGKPREALDENMARTGCGKVGNFSIPYGSMGNNLERMVEANTGNKPPPGTGDRMIEAYKTKRPVAWAFLDMMATIPGSLEGTWQSVSGRMRHFKFADVADIQMREYDRSKILNPLERQAKNYPMQEIVAATTARALVKFVRWKAERKAAGREIKSRMFMLLYDAACLMVPLEELAEVQPRIQALLTTENRWKMPSKDIFNFDVDVTISRRWGVKLTEPEKQEIKPYLPAGFSL